MEIDSNVMVENAARANFWSSLASVGANVWFSIIAYEDYNQAQASGNLVIIDENEALVALPVTA